MHNTLQFSKTFYSYLISLLPYICHKSTGYICLRWGKSPERQSDLANVTELRSAIAKVFWCQTMSSIHWAKLSLPAWPMDQMASHGLATCVCARVEVKLWKTFLCSTHSLRVSWWYLSTLMGADGFFWVSRAQEHNLVLEEPPIGEKLPCQEVLSELGLGEVYLNLKPAFCLLSPLILSLCFFLFLFFWFFFEGVGVSKSWELMGQKPTVSVSCCWNWGHLSNLGFRRKSHVTRLGLPRVGQAGQEEVALCKESWGAGSLQWKSLW